MALTKVKLIADGTIVQSHLNASHGITTADISEGSNLYYTDARARAAVSVSGNALSYNSSTGVITSNYEENPVFTTGVTVTNDSGHFTLLRTDGVTQLGKLYDDSGFTIEGKANNNLILRTKANSLGEGIKFQDTSSNNLMFIDGTNGRVGIGTTSPNAKLHLYVNSANDDTFHIFNGSVRTHLLGSESSNGVIYMRNSSNSNTIRINTSGDSYFNGGNVGIGTTSPSAKLMIETGSDEGIRIYRTGTNANFGAIEFRNSDDSATNSRIGFNANEMRLEATNQFRFVTNSSDRMFINSSGNVGIGTTSPAVKLHVDGGDLRVRDSGNVAIQITSSTSANSAIQFGDDGDTNDGRIVYENTGDNMLFYTNDSEKMRITSSAEAHVELSGTAPTIKATASNGASGLRINIAGQTGGQLFRVQEDGSTLFQIDDGGNIGIGETSPDAKLHVVSTTTPQFKVEYDSTRYLEIHHSAIFNVSGAGQNNDLYIGTRGNSGNNDILFYTGGTTGTDAGTERMRIDSSGSVGIGTSSPITKLHVSNSGAEGIEFTPGSGSNINSTQHYNRSTSNYVENRTIANNHTWFNGGTQVATIDSSGRMGIGTTSPSEILHLASTGSVKIKLEADTNNITETDNPQILFSQDGGAVNASLGFEANGGGTDNNFFIWNTYASPMRFGTNNAEKMRIKSTATPQLRIGDGDNEQLAAIRLGGENAGGGRLYFEYNGDSSYIDSYGGHGSTQRYRDLTIGARNLSLLTGNTSGGTRMYIDVNGNVGIGTTSPADKLDVYNGSYSVIIGGPSFSWTGNSIYPTIYGSNSDRWVMITSPHVPYLENGVSGYTGNTSGARVRFASKSGGSGVVPWDVGVTNYGAGPDNLTIGRSATALVTVNNTGDVGIGTLPETAGSTWRTLFVGASLAFISRQSAAGYDSIVANNYYINSSNVDKKRVTGTSSRMFLDGDVIRFQNSASAAADSTVTWSEPMRIAANGNVGIGVTNPQPKLHLQYAGGSYGSDSTSGFINEATSGRGTMRIRSQTNNPAELFFDIDGAIRWDISTRASGDSYNMQFYPQAATPAINAVSAHTFELQQDGDVIVTGGRLGIGTTAPDQKLHVVGKIYATDRTQSANTLIGSQTISSTNFATLGSNSSGVGIAIARDHAPSSYPDIIINSSGDIGMGTASPVVKLNVVGSAYFSGNDAWNGGGSESNRTDIALIIDEGDTIYTRDSNQYLRTLIKKDTGDNIQIGEAGTSLIDNINFFSGSSCSYTWYNNSSAFMKLTSTGLGIGLTSPSDKLHVDGGTGSNYAGHFVYGGTNGAYGCLKLRTVASTGPSFIDFFYDGFSTSSTSPVGAIVTTGTATLYSSYSDYRLKENVADLTGALDKVNSLQPKTFNYINTPETTNEGFIAHELQEIVPQAVSGIKDGVDEDGNPKYQGVDNAHIVPLLVGAIKELKAEIEILKAQINN